MFRQALKVLFPVVVTLSLTLGALAWSASNVAFAAGQPGQAQTTAMAPTATPTAVVSAPVYGAGYAAPFYGASGNVNFRSEKNEDTVGRCSGLGGDRDRSGRRGSGINFGGHLCGDER
jgi:hypothetical protein